MALLRLILPASLAGLCLCAHAEPLRVSNAWLRATVPGMATSAAYMDLACDEDATITAAASPIAARVEIHETVIERQVAKMRRIPQLVVRSGAAVRFQPGGKHLMLIDLKEPLAAGQSVPLTITTRGKDGRMHATTIRAEVRDAGIPVPHHHNHAHH